MSDIDVYAIANQLMAAKKAGQTVDRPSAHFKQFEMPDAYTVGAELTRRLVAGGHQPNGRKLGFTNPALWPRLNLDDPIWAYTYDSTVQYAVNNRAAFSLKNTASPKIEPEIVFKLSSPLNAEDSQDAVKVLQAVEWMALGFEIVDCNYANWHFKAADMVADFGFHTALIIGEPQPLTGLDLEKLAEQLQNLTLKLLKSGEVAAEGAGKNVLGSPALSLGGLATLLSRHNANVQLAAGEVVTTGTLSDAMFITPGETWQAQPEGLDLPPLTIFFE